jgi:hypothetical protein
MTSLRVVAAIRTRSPRVSLELRADGGFAIPALYNWYTDRSRCEYRVPFGCGSGATGSGYAWPPAIQPAYSSTAPLLALVTRRA